MEKETSLDTLAQMMAKGFEQTNSRLDILTREAKRQADDIHDIKLTLKSHTALLADHEVRLQKLEV